MLIVMERTSMLVRLSPGTSLTVIEGKSVLFSVRSGESYGLNETAAQMLRLSLEIGLSGTAAQLAQDYEAPVEEIRSDLDALVKELVRAKLAQLVPPQGA